MACASSSRMSLRLISQLAPLPLQPRVAVKSVRLFMQVGLAKRLSAVVALIFRRDVYVFFPRVS